MDYKTQSSEVVGLGSAPASKLLTMEAHPCTFNTDIHSSIEVPQSLKVQPQSLPSKMVGITQYYQIDTQHADFNGDENWIAEQKEASPGGRLKIIAAQ